jgi:hypothetical protein
VVILKNVPGIDITIEDGIDEMRLWLRKKITRTCEKCPLYILINDSPDKTIIDSLRQRPWEGAAGICMCGDKLAWVDPKDDPDYCGYIEKFRRGYRLFRK